MLGDVRTNHVPVSAFAHGRDVETVCPEFPAPKFLLEIRVTLEELSGGDTLGYLHDFGRRKLWGRADEVMDVIRVYAHTFEPYTVTLFDFFYYN